jgi:hypothetical protein
MNRVLEHEPRDAWLAAALRSQAEHAHPQTDCPSPERIWDAIQQRLSLDDRLEIIDHLSGCAACTEAWQLAARIAPFPPRSSAIYGNRALLIGAAAVLLVALGIGFMVFRPAGQQDAASIEPSPTALPTAQQSPNTLPPPAPTRLPTPVQRAAFADAGAIRDLITAYERLIEAKGEFFIDVENLRINGRTATATIRRRDTVLIQGERQVQTSTHELRFEKTGTGSWVVVSATPDKPLSTPADESDESAIQRVIAIYETAIETKDVELFRSVRPGLSAVEEARLRASFDAIVGQQVTITVDDIQIDGTTAIARVSRQDVIITVGERRQSASSRQILRFEKSASGWIITEIGR